MEQNKCNKCGRPMQYATEPKCNYCDACMSEYCCPKLGSIKETEPDCRHKAVIPSVTVDSVEGITNLANCFVHVNDINTTFYIDDKHRPMITWAGPVDIPGYDMEHNPEGFRDQIVTDKEKNIAVIYDKHGKGYTFGIEQGYDITQIINNKLDEMLANGTLEEIIDEYIDTGVAWTFNTVLEMKSAANLVAGSYAQTLGYYAINDGGNALYKIRSKTGDDTDDGGSIIILDDATLVAELIVTNDQVSVKQFGAHGDDSHIDNTAFENAINYVGAHPGTLFINRGTYKLTSSLNVNWDSTNFNQGFKRSFEICGVSILDSKLHFTSAEGLYINPNNNALVINIHDFCIENPDYNPLEDDGGVRVPDLTHGYGLRVRHIGYMGRVKAIAVRGYYIGIMSSHCYGGPLFENIFTKNTVFGYYSTNDTTVQHNSCSYIGCECGYLQVGSRSTLTNIICESNQHLFKTNEYNQRSKFEGYGFHLTSGANVVFNGCYAEDLYGNAVKIEDSYVIDNLSTFNNFMHSHLSQAEWADLAQWLIDNPGHNYDDIYITLTSQNRNFVLFNGTQIATSGTAYVDVYQGSTLLTETQSVEFRGMTQTGTYANNIARYQQGHTLPILSFNRAPSLNGSTIGFSPSKIYGTPEFCNTLAPTNVSGYNTLVATRKANFTDASYDEVKLLVRQNLDGSIRIYRATFLEGSEVAMTEVIRIKADNTVVFPQNP